MRFTHIDKSLQAEWEKLVINSPTSDFMQSFFWSDFKNKTSWKTYKIGIIEEQKLVAGASILKYKIAADKNFLYIPQGPVLPYHKKKSEKYFHGLISEIDKIVDLNGPNKTTHLRIDPLLAKKPPFFNKFQKTKFNLQPKHTLIINLKESEDKILAQMKQKGRYNIKIAEKHNITVRQKTSQSDNELFMKIYQKTVERNKFKGSSKTYIEKLLVAGDKNTELFFAESEKKVLATALIIFYGKRATYLLGGSSDQDRTKMAPYKLHWEIIKFARKNGYEEYDFFGIAPETKAEKHDWHGLSQFKKKFGGQQKNFIGSYDFVYNKKLYSEYLKLSKEIE